MAPNGAAANSAPAVVAGAVTALFVPGDRPERYVKAAAAGAGAIIIDLEDAVSSSAKAPALAEALKALSAHTRTDGLQAIVRVNAMDSPSFETEIAALMKISETPGHGLLGVMVPKVENVAALASLSAGMSQELALLPLIESAVGVLNALELAQTPGVTRLAFGAIDFALDIDASTGDRFLDYTRAHLVIASRAAGIPPPLDSPATDTKDVERVAQSARLGRNFGFGGKLCIHPAQVVAVQGAFAPSDNDVKWAMSVIGSEGGATQVDGHMIDRPVAERAKRILQRAGSE